jgi:hypothetical protein
MDARIVAMWRPNEAVEEDVSDLPGIDPQSKRRRSRRRAWRDGLADQTAVRNVEDVRAYRAFERALIRSIDPRTAMELALVHRLANLLWRLRRASAIETGFFEMQANFCSRDGRIWPADNRELSNPQVVPMAITKSPDRTDHTSRLSTIENRDQHRCVRRSNQARSPEPSPNDSCALTRACLTAWAGTKRDCGVKQRKQFGLLTL